MDNIYISGFSDEISENFDEQLATVKKLGMTHISLRAADGKGIADYTPGEVREKLLPRLQSAGIGVSSLGSPIGKVYVDDEPGFEKQLEQLENLCWICKMLDCKYIRMFSFYIPEGKNPADYREVVIEKLKKYAAIAEKHGVVLIHENEKDIYGDIASRCKDVLDAVNSPSFKAVFDFANFVQCGEDTLACWELLKDQVVYIHIKDAVPDDNENVLCGTGTGNIPAILKKAIREEGYQGFLTLEPHLVLFGTLQSLEIAAATDVIKENKYKDGAEGFTAQHDALVEILNAI